MLLMMLLPRVRSTSVSTQTHLTRSSIKGPLPSGLLLSKLLWQKGSRTLSSTPNLQELLRPLPPLLMASSATGDVIVTIAIEGQDVAWGTFVVHAIAELAFTLLLGIALGSALGVLLGSELGLVVGLLLGEELGDALGETLGTTVG